jgi:hypothetical protein
MDHCNRRVTSREYKLQLNPGRFQNRDKGADAFWELLQFLLSKDDKRECEAQNREKRRVTYYLDTAGLDLDRCGYILRVREQEDKDEPFKIALKYRHGDRYRSAGQDVVCGRDYEKYVGKGDDKFEEDITPPFISKFSRSLAICPPELPEMKTVEQAAEIFPVLGKLEMQGVLRQARLGRTNSFTAHEVSRWIGRFTLDGSPLPAETDKMDRVLYGWLNFWYLVGKSNREVPLVAEFSFAYQAVQRDDKRELEEFPTALVEGAGKLYTDLQEQTGWILAQATTKTDFALKAM